MYMYDPTIVLNNGTLAFNLFPMLESITSYGVRKVQYAIVGRVYLESTTYYLTMKIIEINILVHDVLDAHRSR